MGDKFSHISGSTIINRSKIEGAVNALTSAGNVDSADAMKKLAELVDKSEDPDARELYEALVDEIQQESPRRSVLTNIWRALKATLPILAQAAAITGVIDKLVAG